MPPKKRKPLVPTSGAQIRKIRATESQVRQGFLEEIESSIIPRLSLETNSTNKTVCQVTKGGKKHQVCLNGASVHASTSQRVESSSKSSQSSLKAVQVNTGSKVAERKEHQALEKAEVYATSLKFESRENPKLNYKTDHVYNTVPKVTKTAEHQKLSEDRKVRAIASQEIEIRKKPKLSLEADHADQDVSYVTENNKHHIYLEDGKSHAIVSQVTEGSKNGFFNCQLKKNQPQATKSLLNKFHSTANPMGNKSMYSQAQMQSLHNMHKFKSPTRKSRAKSTVHNYIDTILKQPAEFGELSLTPPSSDAAETNKQYKPGFKANSMHTKSPALETSAERKLRLYLERKGHYESGDIAFTYQHEVPADKHCNAETESTNSAENLLCLYLDHKQKLKSGETPFTYQYEVPVVEHYIVQTETQTKCKLPQNDPRETITSGELASDPLAIDSDIIIKHPKTEAVIDNDHWETVIIIKNESQDSNQNTNQNCLNEQAEHSNVLIKPCASTNVIIKTEGPSGLKVRQDESCLPKANLATKNVLLMELLNMKNPLPKIKDLQPIKRE